MIKTKPAKKPAPKTPGLIGLSPAQVQSFAHMLAREGRDGDTIVAHINPDEARLLEEHGGSGTINPVTGLPEFKYGGDTKEGGAKGTGSGAGTGGDSSGKGARTDSQGGTIAKDAKQGGIGIGIGSGGSQTGLSDADVDKMVTGGDVVRSGLNTQRGIIGTAELGHAPNVDTRTVAERALGILKGMFDGASTGAIAGGWGAGLGGLAGGLDAAFSSDPAVTKGQVAGSQVKSSTGAPGAPSGSGAAPGGAPSTGAPGGDLAQAGGPSNNGGPGNTPQPGSLAAAAQQARIDQQNAGLPLIGSQTGQPAAPMVPVAPGGIVYPTFAPGSGVIPGYAYNGRFGPGRVSPINWG